MKKQLGLLALGMSVLLMAPVMGQAQAKENPEKSEATVKVNERENGVTMIKNSPDFAFTTTSSENGSTESGKIHNNELLVLNENPKAKWRVELTASQFTSVATDVKYPRKLENTTFKLIPGAYDTDNDHNEAAGVKTNSWETSSGVSTSRPIFEHTRTNNTGNFSLIFDEATLAVKPWAPGGTYKSILNWKLTPTVE